MGIGRFLKELAEFDPAERPALAVSELRKLIEACRLVVEADDRNG
jgi:hypothetical protein